MSDFFSDPFTFLDDRPAKELYGRITVASTVRDPLPRGSCLIVYVQEDIQCQEISCENPILGEQKIRDPRMSSRRTIDYRLQFKPARSGIYIVQTTLNIGWCKTGDDWIRNGDYKNDMAQQFQLRDPAMTARKDFSLKRYDISGGDRSSEVGGNRRWYYINTILEDLSYLSCPTWVFPNKNVPYMYIYDIYNFLYLNSNVKHINLLLNYGSLQNFILLDYADANWYINH